MKPETISGHTKPLALQAILYFVLAKIQGKTRSEAVADFVGSEMCQAFGPSFAVANVYWLAAAGGYE